MFWLKIVCRQVDTVYSILWRCFVFVRAVIAHDVFLYSFYFKRPDLSKKSYVLNYDHHIVLAKRTLKLKKKMRVMFSISVWRILTYSKAYTFAYLYGKALSNVSNIVFFLVNHIESFRIESIGIDKFLWNFLNFKILSI